MRWLRFDSGAFRGLTRGNIENAVFLALLWAMAVANLAKGGMPGRFWNPGNDFLSFYAGAQLAGDIRLYDPEAVHVLQKNLGWNSPALAFIRLPYYAGMLWPLGQLEYPSALRAWMLLNIGATAAFVWVSRPWSPLIWSTGALLASFPLSVSFIGSQDLPLLLLVIALFWRLYRISQAPRWAGFVLSFLTIKFHLFLTIPIFLIRRKDWKVCHGLLIGVGVQMLASFLLQGPAWPLRYLRQILAPAVSPHTEVMPNWHGAVTGTPWPLVLELLASVVTFAIVWFAAGHPNVKAAFAAALVSGLLLSRHAYVQDGSILLPVCLLLLLDLSVPFPARLSALLCLCPVVWILTMVPGATIGTVACVTVLLFLIWNDGRHAPPASASPAL